MANIRNQTEIILSLLDFFRLAQPDLDTKNGTVARDLFIESQASVLALLYDELSGISDKQSLRLVIGSDLDKLAKNYGIIRRQSTPSGGVALLTFSSLNANININKGDIIIAGNGLSFSVTIGLSISTTSTNFYKSVAAKFRDQLDFAGISDQYAVEVTAQATTPGTIGNIGSYSLSRANITGISNITNVNVFTGGTDQETDAAFRNRILAAFSGASVGTNLGYLNTALGTNGVSDAIVIEPGDPLMIRDGTQVITNVDGSNTIISEGSGGKVDIIILGTDLIQNTDSFIFRDKSNDDPTNSKNDVVLGQISGDENKTVNKKRIDNIKNGILPAQPVDDITQISGSLSGTNFIPKSIDQFGRISGNYELLKDTGVYKGSPWGFDKLHWISDRISFSEDRVKGQFNGQDTTTFIDVTEIPDIQQNLTITNENSIISTDRSIIQLLHTPATNVTRVFNINTGERYIITNQNLDQTGTFNTTGRIKISGNTLPVPSDVLQVDYTWIVDYDQYSDYDGLVYTNNPRSVTDSIDWGTSSSVKKERVTFALNSGNNYFIGTTNHSISTVISANKFVQTSGTVVKLTSGIFINRLAVIIQDLSEATNNIGSIKFINSNIELYNTTSINQSFSNSTQVVGIEVLFITTIILPTDTIAIEGDKIVAILNETDVFSSSSDNGSSNGSEITIPSSLINTSATEIDLEVIYLTNATDLFSSGTTSLPASRAGNGFILNNNNGFNNFSIVNNSRREHQVVQKNLSNQFFIELSINSTDFDLSVSQIISVVRLSDGLELWTKNNPGSIATDTDNTYQLILSEINSPNINDRVLAIYYASDIRRIQPFTFNNSIINTRVEILDKNSTTNMFFVPLNNLTAQSNDINFTITEPNSNEILFTVIDGYMTSNITTSDITSLSFNFDTVPDLLYKKLNILNGTDPNNQGSYDIIAYNNETNKITITNVLDHLIKDQISIIRIEDGKDLWSYSGTIDIENNELTFPVSTNATAGDRVFILYFNFTNLRQSPTKIIGNTSDQINNTGIIAITGNTLSKANNIIFTATNTGLTLNISEAVRKALSLNSSETIPSNIKLAKLIKLEKVLTVSSNSDEILEILTTYDTTNTSIKNNLYFANEMINNSNLNDLDFILPNTTNNAVNSEPQNLPKIGDKLRATFYYIIENDQETLSYTRNGTLYTNKKFALINKIFVNSGFGSSQSTKFTATSFTQPNLGARYKIFYDYLAPKQNERINILYNYNKLISDTTFNIENTRPINADVLIKAARQTEIDLTMNVVISDTFKNSTTTVLQNLRDQLTTAMTTTSLGGIVDAVTLINTAQAVNGIARARILYLNKIGLSGQVSVLQAQSDEYFVPNTILLNTESR